MSRGTAQGADVGGLAVACAGTGSGGGASSDVSIGGAGGAEVIAADWVAAGTGAPSVNEGTDGGGVADSSMIHDPDDSVVGVSGEGETVLGAGGGAALASTARCADADGADVADADGGAGAW